MIGSRRGSEVTRSMEVGILIACPHGDLIPANYPPFCLNIPLFYLAQAQYTSFKQVLAFVCHVLVTNMVGKICESKKLR